MLQDVDKSWAKTKTQRNRVLQVIKELQYRTKSVVLSFSPLKGNLVIRTQEVMRLTHPTLGNVGLREKEKRKLQFNIVFFLGKGGKGWKGEWGGGRGSGVWVRN